MKRFIVGMISFYENNLHLKEVRAEDWKSALDKAFPGTLEMVQQDMGDITLDQARQNAFDQDWEFNVIEIL